MKALRHQRQQQPSQKNLLKHRKRAHWPNQTSPTRSFAASAKKTSPSTNVAAAIFPSKWLTRAECSWLTGRSCSIACSTIHKATHTAAEPKPDQPEPEPEKQSNGTVPRPGTVAAAGSKSPFAALDDSKELRTLFNLYPGLPALLEEIDTATLPPVNNSHNADFGMARGQKEEPWNLDRGLQKGVQALSRARNADGKDAESLREYSKLILQIMSGEAAESAAQIIQKEVAADNAKFIEALLRGER